MINSKSATVVTAFELPVRFIISWGRFPFWILTIIFSKFILVQPPGSFCLTWKGNNSISSWGGEPTRFVLRGGWIFHSNCWFLGKNHMEPGNPWKKQKKLPGVQLFFLRVSSKKPFETASSSVGLGDKRCMTCDLVIIIVLCRCTGYAWRLRMFYQSWCQTVWVVTGCNYYTYIYVYKCWS